MSRIFGQSFSLILIFISACAESDPQPKTLPDARIDAAQSSKDLQMPDAKSCVNSWALGDVQGDANSCAANTGDYVPGSATDGWDACISDDNTYHPHDVNITSIARVAAFETIKQFLIKSSVPSAQDFVDAKLAYTQAEGLDSRVSRREDEHYPAATKACADMTTQEIAANPLRCVGQAQIQPLLNAAFADGAAGNNALINAAKIESGLLWFLYVSVYKESFTCTKTLKDGDSGYAYYTGGEPRTSGKGLATYARAVSTKAHERIWDGLLAVRCWRDLDKAVPATNTALRDKALAQLDRALLRSMALITKARILAAQKACGLQQEALWISTQILGNVLDREANVQSATQAQQLKTQLAKTKFSEVDVTQVASLLDSLFPCP